MARQPPAPPERPAHLPPWANLERAAAAERTHRQILTGRGILRRRYPGKDRYLYFGLPGWVKFRDRAPVRDWAALDERKVPRAAVEEMLPDELHRDAYPKARRLKAWDSVERNHQWAREHNAGWPVTNGIYLIEGGVGAGKTNAMMAFALSYWETWAVPVFTNMSALTMFHFLSPAEMFSFMDKESRIVPKGSIILLDEIAALAVRGRNSSAQQELSAVVTTVRKNQWLILCATAAPWQISSSFLNILDGRLRPSVVQQYEQQHGGYNKWGRELPPVLAPARKTAYPPYCYLGLEAASPVMQEMMLLDDVAYAEETGLPERRGAAGVINTASGLAIRQGVWTPSAAQVYRGSLISDTYDQVPVGSVYGVTAEVMREERNRQKAAGGDADGALLPAADMTPGGWLRAYALRMDGGAWVDYADAQGEAEVQGLIFTQTELRAEGLALGGSHRRIERRKLLEPPGGGEVC